MPRKAKNQPVHPPQDQTYGQSQEMMAAQHQMGIPDNTGSPAPVEQAPVGQPPQPGQAAPRDPQALLQMMRDMPPPPAGGLAAPTERPEEPVTAGISTPVKTSRNRAAEALEVMANATQDPRLKAMAQRARMI